MSLNLELLRVAIVLAGTAYLAWEDHRTSFMNEKLLYGMIGAGVLLTLATLDLAFIIPTLGIAAVIFGIGYFGYKTGGIGGGDVLLFTAIQVLLPIQPVMLRAIFMDFIGPRTEFVRVLAYNQFSNTIPPVLSIIVASGMLALLGTAIMYAWLMRNMKLKPDHAFAGLATIACVVCFWVLQYSVPLGLVQAFMLLAVFAPAIFLTTFRKQILEDVVTQRVALDDIEDEDILSTEKLSEKVVEKYGLQKLLDADGLRKLNKTAAAEGWKTVPIAKVLPRLGLYILIGLTAVILAGDVLAFFLLLT
ncbi:hypothetical protein AUJ14_00910 [Candidatus Micrarchaeota archaeon CG1_02_55_22]|nr:MAG: hypothetical protein AUJ14_00910 [Candidatus Micrarchaeota archaeon CG1_02_55_22]